jgi:hypothetical protein
VKQPIEAVGKSLYTLNVLPKTKDTHTMLVMRIGDLSFIALNDGSSRKSKGR